MKPLVGIFSVIVAFGSTSAVYAGSVPDLSTQPSVHPETTAAAVGHQMTTATVQSIDAASGKVVLQHDPIVQLQWPQATMSFSVVNRKLLEGLRPGDRVQVAFVQRGPNYVITWIQ